MIDRCSMCKDFHKYPNKEYVRVNTYGFYGWTCEIKDEVEYKKEQKRTYELRDKSLDCKCDNCCDNHPCLCSDEKIEAREKNILEVGYKFDDFNPEI